MFRRACVVTAALLVTGTAPSDRGSAAHADELHLGKGFVEGRIVDESKYVVHIETVSGVLVIPVPMITRRVSAPSRMEQYEQQRDLAPLTVERHVELARWARAHGLFDIAEFHIQAALNANPQDADARREGGFVRVGELWLKGREPRDTAPSRESLDLLDRLVAAWHPLIRTIHDDHFAKGAGVHLAAIGRIKLLEIDSALAIPAACRVLGDGGVESRRALAELLGQLGEDAATLNLTVMALLDGSPEVRAAAHAELTRRSDRRVALAMRMGLHCEVETLLHRAVDALGRLGDTSAVEELILILPRKGLAGRPIAGRELFAQFERMFSQPTVVPLGERPLEFPATIAFSGFRRTVGRISDTGDSAGGEFRTYVQDALTAITGENYGFDLSAWRDWAAKQARRQDVAP